VLYVDPARLRASPRSGDPRELDLSTGVDTLFDVAHNRDVGLTTPDYAAEAGVELAYFQDQS